MIDAISIFTKGGVVLWSYYFIKLKGDPIDSLIKTVLLEDKIHKPYTYLAPFNLKWKLLNEFNLVMVIVYQGIQQLIQLDSFLDMIAAEFIRFVGGKHAFNTAGDYTGFDEKFLKISRKFEQASISNNNLFDKKRTESNIQGHFTSSGTHIRHITTINSNNNNSSTKENDDDNEENRISNLSNHTENVSTQNYNENFTLDQRSRTNTKSQKKAALKIKTNSEEKKNIKEHRTWDFLTDKVNKKEMLALDYSKNKEKNFSAPTINYGSSAEMNLEFEDVSSDLDEEDTYKEKISNNDSSNFSNFFSSVNSIFQNFAGNMTLTPKELERPLSEFKSLLMIKNVAEEVADMITSSVKTSLLGYKSKSFTSAREMVKLALTESIQKILTPKKSIDVLKSALQAKENNEVYSIVFMGVNGVGKSTNLAKVCYYLKNKGGLKVMIVACDTFRSGAVEQLKYHAKCLDVHLFERGYGKDAAHIAQESLKYAQNNGYDVVLIDTAGRMQDNVPLMKSLTKLISLNNPNLILFVGEALVGNDGVDQLKKFNQCLNDLSDVEKNQNRNIDGILLTKFDTVDDKVGAALSMSYITGQPIVFVGIGQKYPDLKRLNAKSCTKALLS